VENSFNCYAVNVGCDYRFKFESNFCSWILELNRLDAISMFLRRFLYRDQGKLWHLG